MKVTIQPSEPSQIKKIVELENICFSCPWSENALLGEMTKENSLMVSALDENKKVIGYGGFIVMYDEAHIVNVAVSPAYRRCGIGGALVAYLINAAQKNSITAVTLEVRVSNAAAIGMYEKCGFISAGVRKGYYTKPPEDALIMWRREKHEV